VLIEAAACSRPLDLGEHASDRAIQLKFAPTARTYGGSKEPLQRG
jgi:hypothetical protein